MGKLHFFKAKVSKLWIGHTLLVYLNNDFRFYLLQKQGWRTYPGKIRWSGFTTFRLKVHLSIHILVHNCFDSFFGSNKVRRLLWPLGEGKCGKGGGKWYKESGKCIIKSRIEFPDLILMTLDTPHGPITKCLKKCPKNSGKMRWKIIFFCHFGGWFKN